jgi:Phytanoyl-CoA dioxygenase (PhyH)
MRQHGSMSVDFRTRVDGPHEPIDAGEFLAGLHGRFEARDDLAELVAWLSPRPLTIEVDGDPWTLASEASSITCRHGATTGRHARVRLSAPDLDDLVADQATFMAMFSAGRLDQPEGTLPDLLDWSLLLRAVIDDRPVVMPSSIGFDDLDLTRSFRIDDDPDELRHFLETAGFLHLEGVFGPDEMAQISSDMDAAVAHYAPEDGQSWWATVEGGVDTLVRMQGFDRYSPTTATLLDADPRLSFLGSLPADGHVQGKMRNNRVEALFKPIGVVAGISDVPWHKDCSLGRHSYECCSLTVGISVTGADSDSGQLRVVAGSHRATVWPAFVRAGTGLPEIDLPTRTGDITVHLSCTNHMAQPPVSSERRVLYTGFGLPHGDADAARAARDRLRRDREAAPVTVSQQSTRPVSGSTGGGRARDASTA